MPVAFGGPVRFAPGPVSRGGIRDPPGDWPEGFEPTGSRGSLRGMLAVQDFSLVAPRTPLSRTSAAARPQGHMTAGDALLRGFGVVGVGAKSILLSS